MRNPASVVATTGTRNAIVIPSSRFHGRPYGTGL